MKTNYLQIGADVPPAPPKDEFLGVPTSLLLFAGLATWVWMLQDRVKRVEGEQKARG